MSIGLYGVMERWDYQQDAAPATTPTESGITWLRTTDFMSFVFDQPSGLWIAMGTPAERSMHGPDSAPPIGAGGTQSAWMHARTMNTTGESWRNPHQLIVTDMSINSTGYTPGSDWGVQIVRNGNVDHTIFFNGTGPTTSENDIGLAVINNRRILLRLVVGSSGGATASAFRWSATIHYKWTVTG